MPQAAAAASDPAYDILKGVNAPQPVKAAAWDVFQQTDEPTFTRRLKALNLPQAVKAQLWDAKFGKGRSSLQAPEVSIGRGTSIGPAPSRWWDVGDFAAQTGGMLAGGETGAEIGSGLGVPGAVAGAIIGAAGGSGAMEYAYAGLQHLLGKMGVTSLKGVTPDVVARRSREATATGATSEAFGRATAPLVSKALAPMVDKLEPYAEEAMATFRRGGKAAVLPSEVSKSRILGVAENIAEGSLFGGGLASDVKATRQAIAENRVVKLLDSLGPKQERREIGRAVQSALPESPAAETERAIATAQRGRAAREGSRAAEREALRQTGASAATGAVSQFPAATPQSSGQSVRSALASAIKAFRAEGKQAWGKFETLAAHVPMDAPEVRKVIAALRERETGGILPSVPLQAAKHVEELIGTGTEAPGSAPMLQLQSKSGKAFPISEASLARMSPEVRRIVAEATGMAEGPVTVVHFEKTVSDLGRIVGALQKSAQADPAKYNAQLGLAKALYAAARTDMDTVLKKVSPDAYDAYQEAMAVSRLGNERLFNANVRQVTRQSPEKIAGALLQPNNSTAIKLTTNAVGDESMQPVRRIAMERLLEPDPVTKEVDWKRVVRRFATMGADTTDALFPKGEAKAVLRVADSIVAAQRLLDEESKAEVGQLAEARATARAARRVDQFGDLRDPRRPERIVKKLFQSDNVTAVEAVHQILGDRGFAPVQRAAMEMVLKPDPETNTINWADVVKRLDRIDPETLRAFYPNGHAEEVKRLAGLMLRLQRQTVGGTGKVAIALTQGGAVMEVASGKYLRGAAAVLMLPQMIAKVFGSPWGLKWLTTGLEAPAWSPAAIKATANLIGFLLQDRSQAQPAKAGGQ